MPWLTIEDAARRVQRQPRTIKQWISRGLLQRVVRRDHDGRRLVVVREMPLLEVDALMRSRVGGRPPAADPEYII